LLKSLSQAELRALLASTLDPNGDIYHDPVTGEVKSRREEAFREELLQARCTRRDAAQRDYARHAARLARQTSERGRKATMRKMREAEEDLARLNERLPVELQMGFVGEG
jgi:hypothetical protein